MLLSLIRINESPSGTTGILLIGGKPFCGTLEPPVVPNAQHPKGAIPVGWYKLTVTRSPKFGRLLPLLHYVPNSIGVPKELRSNGGSESPEHLNVAKRQSVCEGAERVGIRIHAGNNREHTSGCILVGKLSGTTLYYSLSMEKELVERLNKHNDETHYIEVTTPERFFTEHCSSIDDVSCLLYGAKYDHDQPLAGC